MDDNMWKEWTERGEDFLKWAKDNFEDGNYQLVGFLCQQSMEMLLKGLLYRERVIPPKIHDLLFLTTKFKDVDVDWNEFKEELGRLSGYYFESRYPGEEAMELNRERARQVIEDVEEMWKVVKARVEMVKE